MLVVDLDVHQGDGTHAALAGDDEAFTLSLNGLRNYPFRRVAGDLERDLPGRHGRRRLSRRARLAAAASSRACARRAVLLPRRRGSVRGRPPRAGWRSRDAGLAGRDQLVRSSLLRAGIPVCVTLAGGYAERIEDTVAINLATLRAFA